MYRHRGHRYISIREFDRAIDDLEKASKLIAMHDLQLYSQAWCAAVNKNTLCDAMADLIGPNVELHHSTLHAKPPETGHPFPMHQDWAFYPHSNDDLLAVGVMLDDATDDNGPLMIVPGTHRGPVFDHHHDGRFCGAIDSVAAKLDTTRAVALTAPAGAIKPIEPESNQNTPRVQRNSGRTK